MGKDTGDPEAIATLRRLLGLYEGVIVDRVRLGPSGSASVSLRVSNLASLARLACCAQNANVTFFIVYLASPRRFPHSKAQVLVSRWLGEYADATPGTDAQLAFVAKLEKQASRG
jgi:hypothetical protein